MKTRIEHELRKAVEDRCRPNLDDVDAKELIDELEALGNKARAAAARADDLLGYLLWLLLNHQGSNSPVGSPIRRALGLLPNEPLGPEHWELAHRAHERMKKPNTEVQRACSAGAQSSKG